jgi:hypothetical protein
MSELEFYQIVGGKVIVTTSTGWRVECLPYADQLMLVGSALTLPDGVTEPDPPRYEMRGEFVDGETRPYDEKSINGPDVSTKDKAAWEQYLADKADYDDEVSALQTRKALLQARFMALKATRVIDQPDLGEWKREQEEWGIPRPDDPNDLKFAFFIGEVCKGTDTHNDIPDATKLFVGISKATGANQEALDSVEEGRSNRSGHS